MERSRYGYHQEMGRGDFSVLGKPCTNRASHSLGTHLGAFLPYVRKLGDSGHHEGALPLPSPPKGRCWLEPSFAGTLTVSRAAKADARFCLELPKTSQLP